MTLEAYDKETARIRFAMTVGGHSPAEVAEVIGEREAERERLLRERDETELAYVD